ncbi:hypothetical protein [Nocardia sp. JCM 34519]|uniref:hypothetical protein n=1 Tax=Nocardia sp. JCM 34519 TaxID=2876118 RepID=UPI001CE460C7|nr:hypothetical protein [Nocardia sp. JCM 34519]
MADILMAAVLGETARDAALRVAAERGRELGGAERGQRKPGRLGAERALTLLQELLVTQGFEPGRSGSGCIRLHNCPFHPLAASEPELVCGLNRAYLTGMLDGLEADAVEAALAPRPGECCVELRLK